MYSTLPPLLAWLCRSLLDTKAKHLNDSFDKYSLNITDSADFINYPIRPFRYNTNICFNQAYILVFVNSVITLFFANSPRMDAGCSTISKIPDFYFA